MYLHCRLSHLQAQASSSPFFSSSSSSSSSVTQSGSSNNSSNGNSNIAYVDTMQTEKEVQEVQELFEHVLKLTNVDEKTREHLVFTVCALQPTATSPACLVLFFISFLLLSSSFLSSLSSTV